VKRFRASVLTGFIACGLLFLNLLGFAFASTADSPVVSCAASVPVDGDDADAAGLTDVACLSSARREVATVALRKERAADGPPHQISFRPSLVLRHSSLTWHLAERAAAAPRAPAFRA